MDEWRRRAAAGVGAVSILALGVYSPLLCSLAIVASVVAGWKLWPHTELGKFKGDLGKDGWASLWEVRRHLRPAVGSRLGRTVIGTKVPVVCSARFEDVIGTIGGPRRGKALSLDTPIATPTGWTTMGELQIGDQVFDRHGEPCRVTFLSEIFTDHECFEVRTSDGESIIADADHRWIAQTRPSRPEKIVTTKDLAPDHYSKGSIIKAVPGLNLPHADLPLDPYLLGIWLGDGSKHFAYIYTADHEIVERIRGAGYTVTQKNRELCWHVSRQGQREAAIVAASKLVKMGMTRREARELAGLSNKVVLDPDGVVGRPSRVVIEREAEGRVRSVYYDLNKLNVLMNKHVPMIYMRSSEKQRLALLQGLIDSDGYVCPDTGRIEFCSTNLNLAESVRELVFSLGSRAYFCEGRATLNGRDCGPKYRVQFHMLDAAWLPRKAERCRAPRRGPGNRHVRIRPAKTVPVRCIQVDSPDHTYLAGRTMLPTHNTLATGRRIRNHPGAAIVSSTRLDLRKMTLPWRQANGRPVWSFLPEGTGRQETTLRWSPLVGCTDPVIASKRAGALVEAIDSGSDDDQTWMQSGASVLSAYLLAAATAGLTMREVYSWVTDWRNPAPLIILAKAGYMTEAAGLASEVTQSPAEKTASSVIRVVKQATEFMRDPNVAKACCPGPNDQFTVEDLIARKGTLYMVGSSRSFSPTGPLIAALWSWLFDETIRIANDDFGGCLSEPILFAMDEIAVTARVALDDWTAYCGGHGIHVDWTAQNKAQLRNRWGQDGADSIWDNTTALLIFGGIKNDGDLSAISNLCGERSETSPGKSDGAEQYRTMLPASVLRRIPKFRAVLIHSDIKPTVLATSRWWRIPAIAQAAISWRPPTMKTQIAHVQRQALPPGPAPAALPPAETSSGDPEGVEAETVVDAA